MATVRCCANAPYNNCNVGFRSSTQPTSLIPSSFPRRRESMRVIPLGSRLRGNDGFVGWVDDCMDAGGRVLSGTSTERSETQQGTQFVGCVQTAGRRTEIATVRCYANAPYEKGSRRHSRAGGNPCASFSWVPAYAETTKRPFS